MEFASIPRISLYASFLALTACGGGGSSGGSDGGSARSSYTGPTSYAALSEANQDELIYDTYYRLSEGLIVELLEYDELFEDGMEELYYYQQRSFDGSEDCDSGRVDYSASANENFTRYELALNYRSCDIDGASSNGKFNGEVQLSSPGGQLYNATLIAIKYNDFRISESNNGILISGEETRTHSTTADTYTISQDILVKLSNQGNETQGYYDNISLTRNEGFSYEDPINVVSLSGSYYHSDFGRVDLSIEQSDQFDGNKVILTGSNSTIVIDYIEAMAQFEVSLDTNGDGVYESQETGNSLESIID